MKFRFERSEDKEEVVVYAKERNEFINSLENICLNEFSLIGYQKDKFKELNPLLIDCFITYDEKIYAIYKKERYLIKKRLYELNEIYKDNFIYINQGCLGNIHLIDHFEVSIGGALMVVFKSNYKDFVSRRNVKNIKERLGIK